MTSELTLGQRLHKLLLLARIPASILMALAILVFARPTIISLLVGLLIVALGEALRIWASGHIHKMAEVTQTGPYAMCRHPLYLGHFIIALGFCAASASWIAFAVVVPAFFVMYAPTWKNEERYLTGQFGEVYQDYMKATPALIPHFNRACLSGSFNWQLVTKHREWNHIALLLAGLLILTGIGFYQGF